MRQALPVLLLLLVCVVPASGDDPVSTKVVHVDDDAPRDAGLGDPRESGTREHAFSRIQDAIEVAADGMSIFVHPGTYHETIDLLGKHITLTGFDPNDPNAPAWPVIDGGGAGPVVSFTRGEDANCVLSGFVIMGGGGQSAGAILCSSSSPTVAHCLIVGNRATGLNGAAVRCMNSDATFANCTISGNRAGRVGAALHLTDSNVAVVNSIIWGNTPAEILADAGCRPTIRYSNVAGGWQGQGCMDADPFFAEVGTWVTFGQRDVISGPDDPNAVWLMGDFRLQSQMGRYDSGRQRWVLDRMTSSCIDAGDPNDPFNCEPSPNGGVINLGVYGGTVEASKSWSDGPVRFPDANLKAAVEQELWISDPTPADMLGLTQLIQPNMYTRDNAVTNLTGLEYAVNLRELNLRYHSIGDISPLSGLINLQTVILLGNYISVISPLSGLSDLRTLDLEQNEIRDISALSGLSNLESLALHRNFVTDISPLSNLTHLTWVDLRANPMNADAYSTYLSRIEANNPGVTLLHDLPFTGRLVVSSTPGGSVIQPGVGVFTYGFYEVVVLEAKADPGFEFVGWSGSYSASDNPLVLTMDQNYELQAVFRSIE